MTCVAAWSSSSGQTPTDKAVAAGVQAYKQESQIGGRDKRPCLEALRAPPSPDPAPIPGVLGSRGRATLRVCVEVSPGLPYHV